MTEIVSTSDTLGAKPRIEGTRVSAEQVYEMYSIRGMSADEIADELPTVSSEQVEDAIQFMRSQEGSDRALEA